MQENTREKLQRVEARWPAVVAALATGLLFFAMPESLTVGPGWLLFSIVAILMIPVSLTHRTGRVQMNDIFAYAVLTVITLAVLSSLILLVTRLPAHKETPVELL